MKGMERFILTASLLTLLLWRGGCQSDCGKWQYTDEGGHCVPCLECPLGEEPDGVCGFGTGAGVTCQKCGPGMFSSHSGISFCNPHTLCEKRKRVQLKAGTPTSDAQCGDCLPGFFSPVGKSKSISTCFQCALAPPDTVGCEGLRTLRPRPPRTIDPSSTSNIKMPLNNTQKGVKEDSGTEYAVLAIVPVFCMMGLMGIFLCNLLKKKGYHCTSQKELDEEEASPEKNGINPACMLEENGNEDTIGVLVRLITEKKENAVALEELLKEYQSKPISPVNKASQKLHLLPQMPHMCKHQNHMHTIQGQASRSGLCCSRCSQKKWTDVLLSPDLAPVSNVTKASRTVCKPGRTGEITILSVGRFRVARIPEQKVPPPEVKTISDQNVPLEDGSEQRGLLCNTVRAKNRSLEDTSKLEDVI
ncbi:tumor necrosis factor receptor superfamily member 19L isoform X1 [Pelobates cultripes]|uniref:Tumor necrosis factor receptor superfamily member 19L isoform X1 n=1 Tax=Pelobates cultripes TaxID=61616 RepID=A0AAD1R810_PELCU|nr:tumor necrosis factor receptor superfamily member 19L isoform X1 [Pelobates cultripes]